MPFGEYIRSLRESRNLYLRQVAAKLDIDTAMMSKIERGDRKAKREQLPVLALLLDVEENKLKVEWLADRVVDVLKDEDDINQVLNCAKKALTH